MTEKKNKGRTLLLLALLVLVIAGAAAVYPMLERAMEAQQPAPQATTVPADGAPQANETGKTEKAPQAAGPVQRFFAPDFTVYDREGGTLKLSDLRGKPAVVNFFASWCGPCKIEMPYFEEAYQAHGEEITFLMVNLNAFGNDTKEKAEAMVADGGYTFPVYFDTDGEATLAYAIRSMPMTLFVSPEGELVGRKIGAISKAELDRTIAAMIEDAK